MNKEAIAELLGRAIESTEASIEHYNNTEMYCDDEEQAEAERETLEFLLDELVNARTALLQPLEPEVMKTFDRTFEKTPYIVRKPIEPVTKYEDVAAFANERDAIQFAKQIRGGN